MDNYKLTYFNLRGVAEPIRLIFKYANVAFEDVQVDCKKWNDVKKVFTWQQLPFLEYNGKTLTQSAAIGKFLQNSGKFDLDSDVTSWDQAKLDEVVEAVTDLRLQMKPMVLAKMEGNPERAEEIRKDLMAASVPLFFKNLNDVLLEVQKSNPSSDLILGGAKPTWADFWLAHFTDSWSTILGDPNLLEAYPLLKKQQKAVYTLPGVIEWIEERPDAFI